MISFRSTVLAGIVVLAAIVPTGLVAQPKAKPTLDYDSTRRGLSRSF